ncbi:MAG: 1-deoxy-D-xylulose-5-phosphate synthase [Alphaproteobacteria bacterium MarineAlpha6_Bin4]|nr:MAG: 1-deoxy-D-xylulose-5-phosphate synthase [Alphaproteobacteria bacterium MarineAlpha6_Bin3]PPR37191.1 MAG: 1-deoxy-D-xylulose-5-phosphate synthase [Alphaproteobacteria bacterium MarineAlpha6_Bin4]|tara:strand:- start:2225 stop:3193 length:969 start_codon:yes stop_codon:yes gene_type:complete
MIIDEKNSKMWSMIGSRATFGLTMLELGKENDLMVLTADTSTSAGLDRFKKTYPEKFLDVGIAEQNLIGIAAGLSSEGIEVFTATFGPFQTMRCCEQIKVNVGYMKHKICMVGLASGVVLGTLGYTHCCIEDMSIIRSIPGITIISPADCTETVKATQAAIKHKNSIYLRLTGGMNQPVVYNKDYNFEIGKGIKLSDKGDISIIATGTMVHKSMEAAKILEGKGMSAKVINMHTIKPIDEKLIDELSKDSKLLVTVEEHSVIGGLGSAVADFKSTLNNAPPQLFIGLPNEYKKSGEYSDILDNYGLTAEKISQTIENKYKSL